MKSDRRHAREIALEILYQKEIIGCSMDESITIRETRVPPDIEAIPEFTIWLTSEIDREMSAIDAMITGYADNWVIERMPIIDRNLLRMAICEMLHAEDIPFSVSINEAVELAKAYSTAESGKFINGVLGKIAKELESKVVKTIKGV